MQIIDAIAEDYRPLLIFSGGEPLLYPHIFEVSAYAGKKGLKIALATNATLVNKDLAKEIKSIGFHRVSVSLDGATKDINDSLRGEGAFLNTLHGIWNLKSFQIPLQINTTLFRRNFKEITSIYKLCLDLKVEALHIFCFVPVGCGISIPKEEGLSPEEYEIFLGEMVSLASKSELEIKLTCAPHYNRLLLKTNSSLVSNITKGCLAGSGVCFISSQGEVYPCGYLKLSAGNILKDNFKKIWTGSYLFQTLRSPDYLKGRCSICEYISVCGGCRARAYAATGDYLAEEPECIYQPLSASS